MNRKAWTARPLLFAALLLVVGAPAAFAASPPCDIAPADEPPPPDWAVANPSPPEMSPEAKLLGSIEEVEAPAAGWFIADPTRYDGPYDAQAQLDIYDQQKTAGGPGKHMNPTANPPFVLGRRLYDRGAYLPRPTWLGAKNPINSHFMAFGDFRVGAAVYDNGKAGGNGKTEQSVVAARLNLDMDLALTATERIHAFARPLDQNGSFTRYQIRGGTNDDDFVDELNFNLKTLFFEGDAGAIAQGLTNRINQIDLPFAVGRVPLFTQNGIWLDDAFDGVTAGITAKHSAALDISNFDVTFFAGLREVTTTAAPGSDDNRVIGLATFADAHKGYFEAGYGYLDADDSDLSYHNVTAAFSRRYGGLVANSVRVIGNFGQSAHTKTADGVLVLLENSLIPRRAWNGVPSPINVVPYFNLFAGFDSPQPLARAADSGGVLKNTGINFETDGLTGYPTLDAGAKDSYGGAFGLEYLFGLDRQLVVEGAVVERMRDSTAGSQYALGARFQHPFTNAWIVRFDAMHGWREGQKNVYGIRMEIRRKL